MKIIFLENSILPYSGADKNNSFLRGAELAIINLSEELASRGHYIKVFNNCSKNQIVNNVDYQNINQIHQKVECDIAVVNADANLFKHVKSSKNFLFSHSVQNFEKFIRKKQLLAFIKYKPIVLCCGKYHYDNRSFFTSFYGKKIITPSIDDEFFYTELPRKINSDIIFYSRADRNGQLVIDIWKDLFKKFQLSQNLFISTDFEITDQEMIS